MKACDYWEEVVAQSLEEQGIEATPEQIVAVATDMQVHHENYGMAFGQPSGNPERDEIKRLENALQNEREKVTCRECKGTGVITSQGPHHGSWSQCDKCRGTGRHS